MPYIWNADLAFESLDNRFFDMGCGGEPLPADLTRARAALNIDPVIIACAAQ